VGRIEKGVKGVNQFDTFDTLSHAQREARVRLIAGNNA